MDDLIGPTEATDAESRIFDMKAHGLPLQKGMPSTAKSPTSSPRSHAQVANLRLRAELQRIRSCEKRSRDRSRALEQRSK